MENHGVVIAPIDRSELANYTNTSNLFVYGIIVEQSGLTVNLNGLTVNSVLNGLTTIEIAVRSNCGRLHRKFP